MSNTGDDIPGLIGDMIRLGVIASVDLGTARVTVELGDVVSPPCPWLELAGAFRSWVPPVAGEQILLLCPEGDVAHGLVLRGIYSTAFPAPGSDGTAKLRMPDGTLISYDPEAHSLTIDLANGSAKINAPEGVTINGDVSINGNVAVVGDGSMTGTFTAQTDVVGAGKSLKGHKHSGVQSGSSQTGAPV